VDLTPTTRSLVFYHTTARRNMIRFRQEFGGKLFVSIDVDNVAQLTGDPGLLVCTHNTLSDKELVGTYENSDALFSKELLTPLDNGEACSDSLGSSLAILAAGGVVEDLELTPIATSMTFRRTDANGEMFAYFTTYLGNIELRLVSQPPNPGVPVAVVHTDFPVAEQGELLLIDAGTDTVLFSRLDLKTDSGSELSARAAEKFYRLFVAFGLGTFVADNIEANGKSSTLVSVPSFGRIAAEEALKNIMNPPSRALQYRVSSTSARTEFVEPLENRREIVVQTDKDIYLSFGADPADIASGFLVPGGASLGFTLASGIDLCFRAVTDPANVYLLQLGV